MRWVWLLPSQVRVVTAVRSRGGALPEPTGSGGAPWSTPLHTHYVTRAWRRRRAIEIQEQAVL